MIDSIRYKELINPKNLLGDVTLEEFREWALDGTIKDLECTRIELEKEEMFEHCIIINELLEPHK